jgi:hypothetical protein
MKPSWTVLSSMSLLSFLVAGFRNPLHHVVEASIHDMSHALVMQDIHHIEVRLWVDLGDIDLHPEDARREDLNVPEGQILGLAADLTRDRGVRAEAGREATRQNRERGRDPQVEKVVATKAETVPAVPAVDEEALVIAATAVIAIGVGAGIGEGEGDNNYYIVFLLVDISDVRNISRLQPPGYLRSP